MTFKSFDEKYLLQTSATIALSLLILLSTSVNIFGAGRSGVDTSFSSSVFGQNNGTVMEIVEQTDGKLLIGGFFTESNGHSRAAITRLNPDGTNDENFRPPVFFSNDGIGGFITAIAVQSNGKIVVGGSIVGTEGVFRPGIYRLNPDGTFDPSFNTSFRSGEIADIEVRADDSLLVGNQNGLFRVPRDGGFFLEITFTNIYDIEILPDGSFYTCSGEGNGLRKYNADFSVDTTFTAVSSALPVFALEVLPNGQILAGGGFSFLNSFAVEKLARINPDGSVDLSFNLNQTGADGSIYDISVDSAGQILIAGDFETFNGVPKSRVAKLNPDGSLDTSFQNMAELTFGANAAFFTSTDAGLIGLDANPVAAVPDENSLLKFEPDGTINSEFDAMLTRFGVVEKIEQQADGKIYISGDQIYVEGFISKGVARLNSDGSFDSAFVSFFNQSSEAVNVRDFEVQTDGKIITASPSGLNRLNADGSLDESFVSSVDSFNDVLLLPDGKILASGKQTDSSRFLRKLNGDGTIDSDFDATAPNGDVEVIALQPDGKILVGGDFTRVSPNPRIRIARYNADGSFDSSFNPPGGANRRVLDIKVQPDGKILLGGEFTGLNGSSSQKRIGRLNPDGSLDPTFIQSTDAPVQTIELRPDGKILIGGTMNTVGGSPRVGFAKLNSDGSLDPFLTANAPLGVSDIDIQTDGRVLIGGRFIEVNGEPSIRVARILDNFSAAAKRFDFDGDGRADIGVFRPETNIWYQLMGPSLDFSSVEFGLSEDIIAPADYDGDGKTDLGIFRPASGDWWYQSSINGAQLSVKWGESGDTPVPGDFDGDGKADFIVFRPSENSWYRFGTSAGISARQFGSAGDKPVSGDFDGDGKSDIGIFRPSTGEWWFNRSLDGLDKSVRWGISGDIPTPADFDGDGRTDFAVFRPETGIWYVLNSSSGSAKIVRFGLAGDKPIPADYDGDGLDDIAVYRPSNRTWYLLRSTDGFSAVQFGISSDIPIPNAFVR